MKAAPCAPAAANIRRECCFTLMARAAGTQSATWRGARARRNGAQDMRYAVVFCEAAFFNRHIAHASDTVSSCIDWSAMLMPLASR